ncbi:hypothetical protein [Flavobacterium akiainvivens]|uniref:hypothetical protein n=1 Tax=Flavobacterium akiainvivens TaxID=1202724 RepID=UPI000B24337F|nr:hypothetical protein [Flavobacterium akiainvivens]
MKTTLIILRPLSWSPVNGQKGKYCTDKYPADECWLTLNNFPDEPLWTLHYKGEVKNLEETPVFWKVNH